MMIGAKRLRVYAMLLADSSVLVACLVTACLLRLGIQVAAAHARQMLAPGPVIVAAQVGVFAIFGLYRGSWRCTGASELWRLAQACLVSMLIAFSCAFLFALNLSRSVLIVNVILAFLAASTLRVGVRTLCGAQTEPEGFEVCDPPDRKMRTCPLCGCETHGIELLSPEHAAGCHYSIH